MKYKIVGLKSKNATWTGVLEMWQGCYCSRELTSFSIESDTRPTKEQILTYVLNPSDDHPIEGLDS